VSSTAKETSFEATKQSHLWWRHPFYRSKWEQWRVKWHKLSDEIPANYECSPAGLVQRLKEAHCDPDVALRLAFLEASHKPTAQSELAKDNKRQQHIQRKLSQCRIHLWKAMLALRSGTQLQGATGSKGRQTVKRKLDQYRNHVLNAADELDRARKAVSLIFIKPKDIESLRALANSVNFENVVDSLGKLIQMCNHEFEVLLWPHAVELHPGHELFTLVSYVKACSGGANFPLVFDLLCMVYEAHGWKTQTPKREAIEKQVERFRKLHSIQPELIAESTAQRSGSGELRRELMTCYPGLQLR
jgi:hypothetical protein